MSKSFKTYLAIWFVSFAAFLVLALSIGGQGSALFQEPSWPIYGFAIAAFLIQLACGYVTFGSGDPQMAFLGLSVLTASSAATVLLAVVSLAFAKIPVIPLWLGICVCCAILALSAIAAIGAKASANYIDSTDTAKAQTVSTMKGLVAKASALAARAEGPEAKAITTKVYEVLRYSDPVSAPATNEVEQGIASTFEKFKLAVKDEDVAGAKVLADELCNLAAERAEICKRAK